MTLYFYSGAKDVAATTFADLQALITALSDPLDTTNAATIAAIQSKVSAFVQSDTGEPLTLYFYDNAATVSSWVTDASTTLAVGLGDKDPQMADTYASTTSFTISGSSRTGSIALNTSTLQNRLQGTARGVAQLTLHIRKTTLSVTATVALLPVSVSAGVLSATPTDLADTSYVTTTSFQTGAVHPLTSITSLTGGGATALDGLVTASNAIPTGYTVLLSYGRVGQTWQLIAGTDAENTATGVVRPDDYNASTNARIWVQL